MEEKVIKKILLVEDDATLTEMYKKKFELEGLEVTTARDGEEGLKVALRDHPHLILLDIIMPKMDGITVMKKLREDSWGKNVPIVILTNLNTDDKILQEIIQHQPAYYLIKTNTTPAEVVEKAREILGLSV